MNLKRLDKPYCFDEKRGYFPYILEGNCPICNNPVEYNFDRDYIRYPELDGINEVNIECDKCNNPFRVKVKITLDAIMEVIE